MKYDKFYQFDINLILIEPYNNLNRNPMLILKFCFLLMFFSFFISGISQAQNEPLKYVVAVLPTPVLNTTDFGSVFGGQYGTEIKRDEQGLIRELEFVALPNTLFKVFEEISLGTHSIFKITTVDYPYTGSELFIDSRFVKNAGGVIIEREQVMPSKEEIISKLNELNGYQYMWGGNFAPGITELMEYYTPVGEIDDGLKKQWCLEGVDCSGLIYQATGGCTPRNTSSLVYYGDAVEIEGKTPEEIAEMIQPLDLIVWKGHLVIALDNGEVIESSNPEGVHKSNLVDRLYSVMESRTPVNNYDGNSEITRFVVRRWIK